MNKKLRILFVLAIVALLFSPACSSQGFTQVSGKDPIFPEGNKAEEAKDETSISNMTMSAVQEPKTITIATFGGSLLDYDLIAQFNQDHNDIQVELLDYGELTGNNLESAMMRLHSDLLTPDAPDLVDVLGFGLNLDKYAQLDVFEDLYTWIDNDSQISREDFLPSVLSLMEHNGKLQAVMSGFSIKTMYMPQATANSLSRWEIADFVPYANSVGRASLIVGTDETLDGERLLKQLCGTTILSFVDFENAKAYFDSQEFRELISLCKSLTSDQLDSPKVRLASEWNFYEIQYESYVMGESVSYVGFPTFGEYGFRHYINNQENYLAMASNGKHKAATWKFLKEVMDENYQKQRYSETVSPTAFPTNVAALDEMILQAKSDHYYTDEDGALKVFTAYGQYDYPYRPATEAEIAAVMQLIYSVDGIQGYDNVISDIVLEETASYFGDELSLHDTISIIQSRASIYLAELN